MVGIGKSGFDSSSYANFNEEHDKNLSFMSGSLMMSKLRILDGPQAGGIPVWREIPITDMSGARTTTTIWIPCWCCFCESWLLTLFRALF